MMCTTSIHRYIWKGRKAADYIDRSTADTRYKVNQVSDESLMKRIKHDKSRLCGEGGELAS